MTAYQKFTTQGGHPHNLNARTNTFSPEARNASFRSSKLSELTGVTLNKARKERKIVETDVQKLHNRIKMLQMEEDKALKKIEETRKKAR